MRTIQWDTVFFGLIIGVFIIANGEGMAMELKSTAFGNAEFIPSKHTGEGPDVSPQLAWSDVPQATKSFALICDDPDAPMGDWVHWVIYDIPAESRSLEENIPEATTIAGGIKQGKNNFGRSGYGGPMPPPGKPHRYFFKLYALDTMLNLPAGLTKQGLLKAMEGHVLEQAQLMGKYKR